MVFYLKASNIQFESKTIYPLRGEASTEEYIKINPFETIPAIVHKDYSLWESAAIITYISEVYDIDNQWYPKDHKIRGRINAYLHWHHQNIRSSLIGYLRAKYLISKFSGAPVLTPEQEAPLQVAVKTFLENLEWLISETGFVARTQTATIADVFTYN